MKTISIHPFSALAGAGLFGLVLLVAGALQAPLQVKPFPRGVVRIAGIPDPRQMVVIKAGMPFVVPQGKLLAITGLGATQDLAEVTLRVDGQDEFAAVVRLPYGNGTSISDAPPGFTAHAGSTVEVGGGPLGCALGYLSDSTPAPGLVRVAGIPDPRQMLVIRDDAPFVVPAGKVLAITGLGNTAHQVGATLQVDGLNKLVAIANWGVGGSFSIRAVPAGLAVAAGSTVRPASDGHGRAWGYLVDA